MKKTRWNYMTLIVALGMICLVLSACGRKNEFSSKSLETKQDTLVRSFAFDSQNQSDNVTYNAGELANYIGYVKSLPVDYGYAELFNYQKAMKGISTDHTVDQHQYSTLDFAAVEPGMVLHTNRNTTQIVDIIPDSSMYSVIVHETMHILQYGYTCEPNKDCIRRCGLAHSYNWEQDHADWTWIEEGSAERMANNLQELQLD